MGLICWLNKIKSTVPNVGINAKYPGNDERELKAKLDQIISMTPTESK